jgi:hypothetical protein
MTVALAIAVLLVVPATRVSAADWSGRFSIWRNGAFATQYLDASCVGATIQMTMNLVRGARDHSKARQLRYLAYAADNSKYPVTDDGADPEGWAAALEHLGAGDDWGWINQPSMHSALQIAAKQIRETNKPVGLLVHLGRHAWLMTGFDASADPLTTSDFTVTAAEVVGPLWPTGTLNGELFDPGPRTWMDTKELSRRFNEYINPDQPEWHGKFVMVVPRASEANAGSGGPGTLSPDLTTVNGFIYVFDRLARSVAVRDFLWLP